MDRCLQLASLGAGRVAPNPLVGAVLVYRDQIIGEGWHQAFGEAHAEVNAINQARNFHPDLFERKEDLRLYVSLEPCAHQGKTPPCTGLIISSGIPHIIIGCRDPFIKVNGRGIETLLEAGLRVETGIREKESQDLNKRFICFHESRRPYVILKWAQTADGKIGTGQERLQISNDYSNRMVHKWRSEEASILVGTNTARLDDPALTTRLWPGPSPVRLVVDLNLGLPASLRIFNGEAQTIIFNERKQEEKDNLLYYRLSPDTSLVKQVLQALYRMNILSVLVEGGARLLQSFIDEGCWDEARVIENGSLFAGSGLAAPLLMDAMATGEEKLLTDSIRFFRNPSTRFA